MIMATKSARQLANLSEQADLPRDFLTLGEAEIWGLSQLVQLREEVARRVRESGAKSITLDMSCVKSLPSGFFGMLHDMQDRGIRVRLYSAREPVRQMEWFKRFFQPAARDGFYRFRRRPLYIRE